MKLNSFLATFAQSDTDSHYLKQYNEVGSNAIQALPELKDLFNQLSGAIFENGLFRVHNIGSFYFWTELAFTYFKEYKGYSYCFAFDWVGRQYAVNYFNDKTLILMLDPATGEVFELEANIESFLNNDLDDFKNGLLEFEKFEILRNKIVGKLPFDQCFGFKQFLFLGGKDELDNFELCDMEVYWELNYQIFCKTRNLPGGTPLNISIK